MPMSFGVVGSPAIPDLGAAVKALIDRDAVTIPPYPGVAMRLQQLVASGNYGMNDLAKVAMTDPVVTGQLLRAANSAAYRGASQLTSVADAVTRIGGGDVVRIAIASSLGAQAGKKGPLVAVRRQLWQEALTCAMLSFHLATARRLNAQEGFVCGLLHDIGKVVGTSSIEVLLAQHKDGRVLTELEWLIFIEKFNTELGLVTGRKWKLSDMVMAVIAQAHVPGPPSGKWEAMVDVVRTADEVVRLIATDPVISAERLQVVSGLSRAEATQLLNAIPAIGPFVASMDDAAPAAGPVAPSQVATPAKPAEAGGEADFPIAILRAGSEKKARCLRIRRASLVFTTDEKPQPKYLLKLRLHPFNMTPFEVMVSVETCQPDPDGHAIEGKLFALAGSAKDQWAALLGQSGLPDLVTVPVAAVAGS
jgi:HD-like signal output (HDOD) protein